MSRYNIPKILELFIKIEDVLDIIVEPFTMGRLYILHIKSYLQK